MTPHGADGPGPRHPVLLTLFAAFLPLAVQAAVLAFLPADWLRQPGGFAVFAFVAEAGFAGAALWLGLRGVSWAPRPGGAFRRTDGALLPLAALVTVAAAVPAGALEQWIAARTGGVDSTALLGPFGSLEGWRFWVLATPLLVLAPAFGEELLFRGAVWRRIAPVHGDVAAWLFTSALFTLVHLRPASMPSLFAVALLLGWFRLRSGGLFWSILAHALNNGLALASWAADRGAAEAPPWPAWAASLAALPLLAWAWDSVRASADRPVGTRRRGG